MLQTIRNAWKIEEIRKRILFTLLILVIVRIGCAIPTPGVNPEYFAAWFQSQAGNTFNFFDVMTGGSFMSQSIFALNITPYITSSIIMQLLTIAIREVILEDWEAMTSAQGIQPVSRKCGERMERILSGRAKKRGAFSKIGIGILVALAGLLISIAAGTPVGSTIVAADALVFIVCCLVSYARKGRLL